MLLQPGLNLGMWAALHVVAVLTPGEKQMIIHLLRPWRTRQEGRATAEHRG